MPRPITATIDLSALRHNLAVAKRAAAGARVLAVVKANAYGHGRVRCAGALDAADGFAILEFDAAVRLREAGVTKPILLLEGVFDIPELEGAVELGLASAVHDPEQAAMIASLPAASRLDVFLKLNTGMNRLGVRPADFERTLALLQSNSRVRSITLMTHFACADDAHGIADQLACFRGLAKGRDLPASLANSATVLRYPEAHGQWVRPGIMLYGCSPFADHSAADLDLRPVMTLASQVIAVQALAPGAAVGYGATFVADRPMRIGVVACGYADGYPRHAPSGPAIVVDGMRPSTVGRVSMDMLCADLTDLPAAGVGSAVTLWGEGLSADEVATAAGTVSYELLCALAARVPVTERD